MGISQNKHQGICENIFILKIRGENVIFAFQMTTNRLVEDISKTMAQHYLNPDKSIQEHFFTEQGLKFILSYVRNMSYEQGYKAITKHNQIKTITKKVYKVKRVKDNTKIMRRIQLGGEYKITQGKKTVTNIVLDVEERESIIEQESKRLGVKIPEEVIKYVAEKFKLNEERLKSITFGICAFKTFTGYELKKYNSASVAASVVMYNQPLHYVAQLVIDKVIKVYKVTEEDLYSDTSTAVLVGARNIISHILHDTFMASYRDIHKIIGRRNHTPVVLGNQDLRKVIKEDVNIRNIVEDISQEVCNDLIDIQKDVMSAQRKTKERKKIEEAKERRKLLGW